jgi:hypothetical protein
VHATNLRRPHARSVQVSLCRCGGLKRSAFANRPANALLTN